MVGRAVTHPNQCCHSERFPAWFGGEPPLGRPLHETDGPLGVQSRSEVGWIVSELPRLVCPSFADVLVGSEPL